MRPAWMLALVLLIALGIRLYMSVLAFASTIDTSTPGLMGLHILKGERPLFFYGQNYMGALEAYVAALLFAVLGPSTTTLSLSPILFTLAWITATYLLFRDLYEDEKVGLMAALCVALPGWDGLWYSLGSYGGYPAAFFLGTLSLWLVVRLVSRELSPASEWGHVLTLGTVAGLGLWTHYLSAVYLLTGAILLLMWFWRVRFSTRVLRKFVVGGVCFLIAFSPTLCSFAEYGGGHVLKAKPTLGTMYRSVLAIKRRVLPRLFEWPIELPPWVTTMAVISLGLASAIFFFTLAAHWRKRAAFGTPADRRWRL